MKKIFFWSPYIDPQVATYKSVKNSILSLIRYNNKFQISLLNVFGEWDNFNNDNILKINLINNRYLIKRKFKGFINSRFLYLLISILSFIPLIDILKKKKPHYLIIHLITSLPLIVFFLNNFDTKLILRISGLPKLNFFRCMLWKLVSNKIEYVLCPTEETKNYLIKKKIFSPDKLFFVPDPIIETKKFNILKKEKINQVIIKPYFLCIGRFTKQKNHIFLLKFFEKNPEYLKKYFLIIIGQGELKKKYNYLIKSKNLKNKIMILDYEKNVLKFINNAKCVISCSLWEDPGFVMIETASLGVPIVTSDCPSGPKEFIDYNKCGFIFRSNDEKSFKNALDEFFDISDDKLKIRLINAKKKSAKYTQFYFTKKIIDIIAD